MKTFNIKNIVLSGFLVLILSSCSNFFDESSQDEIKPTTTEDLAAVLYSEAYPYNFSSDAYLTLLTDEVVSNGVTNDNYKEIQRAGEPIFCFDNEMADGYKSFIADENSWKNYYELIMGCNVILDNVDNMIGTDIAKKEIKGQARLLRAYYYLRLAMVYCQPYRISPEQNLGLTLITTSHVSDAKPLRATVKATYDFIEQELLASRELLADCHPSTVYRVTATVADALLSRLYLYEESWDKVIEHASRAITEGPQLTNFNSLKGTQYNIYQKDGSSEVVWNFSGNLRGATYFDYMKNYGTPMPYTVSPSVKALYDPINDLRYSLYFGSNNPYVMKTSFQAQYDGEHGVRMGEVYLNRAEAYARKGDITHALADINTLRATRYAIGSESALSANADNLLQQVLDERQRELVWEDGFRWMDIKRLGLAINHTFLDENGVSKDYTLKHDDLLYALPIPSDAISRNANLQQNPR